MINGQPRKGIAQAGRTGWVYILTGTNGKPLVGVEEKSVPQEPRQKTRAVQRSIHDSHSEDRTDAAEGDAMPTI